MYREHLRRLLGRLMRVLRMQRRLRAHRDVTCFLFVFYARRHRDNAT